ncbi:uncharacterized protein LOC111356683 [Spodoptera litura]|uniref:Uncharacterized protein LOC111356683 n=1 Tax=Spodoptera litura TaxID=69820 RepID=A0A9J7EF77_SPOLT|nr:uncharacterized protein LOC111356683 [Spodoptera litura]
MLSKILFIALIAGMASAGTMMGRLPPKPAALAHKEGCYIEEINDVIPFGRSVTVGHCTQVICGEKWMSYFTCSTGSVDIPNCYMVQDLSKNYPECCPKIQCSGRQA